MDTLKLNAEVRNADQTAGNIRGEGNVPAVFYGHGIDTTSLQVSYSDFRRVYRKSGRNTLIDLSFGGKPHKALVHNVDFDPVTDQIIHVDFINVRMDEEITATIPVEFIGQSLAVKDLGGTLVNACDEVEVRCLPANLIHKIEVDLSPLVDFHVSIMVKDLVVPSTVKILDDPETVIASVSAPRTEEPEEVGPMEIPEGGVPVVGEEEKKEEDKA